MGNRIAKFHTPRAGGEVSYIPLREHLKDMSGQLILKPLNPTWEIIVRRESAETSV